MPLPRCIDYNDLLADILQGNSIWSIISAVNFEECSITLLKDLLMQMHSEDARRIQLIPLRLVSSRGSPWSALELVKEQLEGQLRTMALGRGIKLDVKSIEYPAKQDVAYEVLADAKVLGGREAKLVLDISALPRELSVFLCDFAFGVVKEPWRLSSMSKVFIVQTPPERITSRQGLGPFSVGAARCVYNPQLVRGITENLKTSLLVFPGYEGFEAKAAVDAIAGHQAMITVAVGYFDHPSFAASMNGFVGNQALLSDALDGIVDIRYYFSEFDALRIALDVVDRGVKICEEFPQYRHAFLVAPFGAKSSIAVASLARREFQRRTTVSGTAAQAMSDVLTLPTSQYVSLYSRGAGKPCVFTLDLEDEEREIR
jgi:hypothetical protein